MLYILLLKQMNKINFSLILILSQVSNTDIQLGRLRHFLFPRLKGLTN